ncbi:thiol-disulfide oxidoreductase DCC family protein [Empedobacter falsenii]|uniref:thiol-disulfide oxidoreductase DCC family protein n=1 Tax=Empedobacter falsenii TaxID=343874 RepID=UPI001C56267F|nr:thiol-disulfide oxidoreductase DCC family protein [Empedobacter falsenii]MBW1618692.1 thiol-disulfide oxidoreductase DCC family protein [Empedobacter falsenii]
MKTRKIILFDGICNLCNQSVQFVIEHDNKNQFQFASLQSDFGQNFLKENNLDAAQFDSVVFIEDDKFYTKSSAALKISKYLDGITSWLTIFMIVPKPLRDVVYSFIAKNRYRWFGKQESCWLPTPELKAKFLD